MHEHSGGSTSYGISNQTFNLTTSWQVFTYSFTTPTNANTSDARLRFWFPGNATNGDVYWIDDVVMTSSPSGGGSGSTSSLTTKPFEP
ncbi:MAG: hypothetical protein R3B47_05715 [Bacteroidia bacterium]